MSPEDRVKLAFSKVKEDVEGVKDELAFALRRLAKLESIVIKQEIDKPFCEDSGKSKKKKK